MDVLEHVWTKLEDLKIKKVVFKISGLLLLLNVQNFL